MSLSLLFFCWSLTGCSDEKDGGSDTTKALVDADEDGFEVGEDCDDADPAVYPGAEEGCDGIDNDCDGAPGEAEVSDADGDGSVTCEDCDDTDPDQHPGQLWFADGDSDGYGNPDDSKTQCDAPPGYVLDNTDCDDADPDQFPGQVWIPDEDGDGYGNPDGTPLVQCLQPEGYTTVFLMDCDDTDPEQFPGQIWHPDADRDGYGSALASLEQCERPSDYVTDDTDCDDNNADVNPVASEICDGLDNNCDEILPPEELDEDLDGYMVCEGDPDDQDPLVIPETVLEDFETGVWPGGTWVSVSGGGTVSASYAHDGSYGITDPDWHYQTAPTFGYPGEILTAWINFASSGRVYLGFDGSSAGGKSFVIGANTGEIMMQDNAGWGYGEYAYVTQSFTYGQWYYVEVEFLGGTEVEGRLYDSDGVTLLNSTSYTFTSLTGGGLTLRSFGSVWIDTIILRY